MATFLLTVICIAFLAGCATSDTIVFNNATTICSDAQSPCDLTNSVIWVGDRTPGNGDNAVILVDDINFYFKVEGAWDVSSLTVIGASLSVHLHENASVTVSSNLIILDSVITIDGSLHVNETASIFTRVNMTETSTLEVGHLSVTGSISSKGTFILHDGASVDMSRNAYAYFGMCHWGTDLSFVITQGSLACINNSNTVEGRITKLSMDGGTFYSGLGTKWEVENLIVSNTEDAKIYCSELIVQNFTIHLILGSMKGVYIDSDVVLKGPVDMLLAPGISNNVQILGGLNADAATLNVDVSYVRLGKGKRIEYTLIVGQSSQITKFQHSQITGAKSLHHKINYYDGRVILELWTNDPWYESTLAMVLLGAGIGLIIMIGIPALIKVIKRRRAKYQTL